MCVCSTRAAPWSRHVAVRGRDTEGPNHALPSMAASAGMRYAQRRRCIPPWQGAEEADEEGRPTALSCFHAVAVSEVHAYAASVADLLALPAHMQVRFRPTFLSQKGRNQRAVTPAE